MVENLGIIGGGQLGSLLCTAAKKLNIKTIIFSDDKNAPAQNFCNEFIFGKYNDQEKINLFTSKVDLVTFEFENIPVETLKLIDEVKRVLPKPKINKIIQNRLSEKDFVNKLNIRTTSYVGVKNENELRSNINLIPGILKTTTLGYDGKGQFKINDVKDLERLNIDFSKDYILEKLVKLKQEISVIITRFGHQRFEIYEPIENHHEDQILRTSKIPANISEKISNLSIDHATIVADELDYIGTLCVEYFIDKNDNLYLNEIAPRVHNSGHLTINSHNISQFENHIRAICGLEKIKVKKMHDANMKNLIGDEISNYRNKNFKDSEFFFDYLKKEIKYNRKMGHLTTIKL
tara:strand:+ start:5239 stop:6282 length:1044 start_codon:yes stop_codon:yes gene_type:complete